MIIKKYNSRYGYINNTKIPNIIATIAGNNVRPGDAVLSEYIFLDDAK